MIKKRKGKALESMNQRAGKVQTMDIDGVIASALRHVADNPAATTTCEADSDDDDPDFIERNTSVNEAMNIFSGTAPKARPKPPTPKKPPVSSLPALRPSSSPPASRILASPSPPAGPARPGPVPSSVNALAASHVPAASGAAPVTPALGAGAPPGTPQVAAPGTPASGVVGTDVGRKGRGRPASTVDLSKTAMATLQECTTTMAEIDAAFTEWQTVKLEKEGSGDKADTKFNKEVTKEVGKLETLIKKVQKFATKLGRMQQDHHEVARCTENCKTIEKALSLLVKVMKAAASQTPDLNAALSDVVVACEVGIRFEGYLGVKIVEWRLDEDFRVCRFEKLMKRMELDDDTEESAKETMVKIMEAYVLRLMKSCLPDDINKKNRALFLTLKTFSAAFVAGDGDDCSMGHGEDMSRNQEVISTFCAPWDCTPVKLASSIKIVKPKWGATESAAAAEEDWI